MNTVTKKQLHIHIRPMAGLDIPEVLKIEQDSFNQPWSEEDFLYCHRRQRDHSDVVANFGDRIVGYMVYKLYQRRFHILNVAVHSEFRLRRVGAQMIKSLKDQLLKYNRTHITLEVRETNLDAQLFFKRQGFLAMRVRRSIFEDTGEDAYCMEYQLNSGSQMSG